MKIALFGFRKSSAAWTLMEIMIVVALIGLLVAIAMPRFIKSRETAQLGSIIGNLRIVESAKDQWALQNQKGTGDTIDWTGLSDFLKGGTVKLVASETYTINPIGSNAFATSSVRMGTYAPNDPITAQ